MACIKGPSGAICAGRTFYAFLWGAEKEAGLGPLYKRTPPRYNSCERNN